MTVNEQESKKDANFIHIIKISNNYIVQSNRLKRVIFPGTLSAIKFEELAINGDYLIMIIE